MERAILLNPDLDEGASDDSDMDWKVRISSIRREWHAQNTHGCSLDEVAWRVLVSEWDVTTDFSFICSIFIVCTTDLC